MLYLTDDFGRYTQCSTIEQVHAESDALLTARVDVLAIDLADGDLTYYPSEVGTRWRGTPMDTLYDTGTDVVALAVERIRGKGQTLLGNIRMNDHHGSEEMWTPWARAHIDWSLGKDTGDRGWRSVGDLRQMNYAVEGVRTQFLNVLREILTRYPLDGLQLDFGRSAPFLSEPRQDNARFLTQFVRDVRGLLDAFGKQREATLQLGAVLPWDLDCCKREGIDVAGWIRDGLLDYAAPGEWYYAEWNMPLVDWIALTKTTKCRLVPMMPGNVAPHRDWERGAWAMLHDVSVLDGPKIRAISENYLAQGAEHIMLYNYYSTAFGKDYPHLRDWTTASTLKRQSRQYYYCRRLDYTPTEHDSYTTGRAFERFTLDKVGQRLEYLFRIHADPGEHLFRFKAMNLQDDDELSVTLNGSPLAAQSITHAAAAGKTQGEVTIWATSLIYPPLQQGENTLSVTLNAAAPNRKAVIEVSEFEVLVEPP